MICVLGEPEDTDVLWLATSLRRRGLVVEVLLPDELVLGSRWSYRVASSTTTWSLELRDGRVMDPAAWDLVVNRWRDLPLPARHPTEADAAFVGEEWRAAATGWLRSLRCPVLNPPRAASITGADLPTAAWRAVATAHGVPSRPWRSDAPGTAAAPGLAPDAVSVLCIAGRCLGPEDVLTESVRHGLVSLARHVGIPLLGATFVLEDGEPVLVGTDPLPALVPGGTPLLDALAELAGTEADPR
ncbi:hypothetical protein E7744_04605 [Citricoccus sp. SGAir0253]|uniref:hypothetical protein n=1 Tax=Citricoccus sp. SGAir0253 TaxID=2567881 RepID=UPI0010CD5396|nr:hypothetical protein [Citricoccus sp. SGAir0253]QCU77579.1 hypothetical protein E7744_04605 [Citricoccus sp. SGAir0253]